MWVAAPGFFHLGVSPAWAFEENVGRRPRFLPPRGFPPPWAFGENVGRRPRFLPVDVQVMPDGALLVSDDTAGAI